MDANLCEDERLFIAAGCGFYHELKQGYGKGGWLKEKVSFACITLGVEVKVAVLQLTIGGAD